MKALVMSHWSAPGPLVGRTLEYWTLSHALARKHYGEVHLITDSAGADALGSLQWSTVERSLDVLPVELANIWSLGKIKAYGIAARRFGDFVHIDGDVFLWEPLPEWLVGSGAFSQHPEDIEHFYDLSVLDYFSIAPVAARQRPIHAPNMGIAGGTDSGFWRRYSDQCCQWVCHPANRRIWLAQRQWWGAILAEQWFLAALSQHEGRQIRYLFSEPPVPGDATAYSHLLGAKTDPSIHERVRARLSARPYDLNPRIR